MDDRKSGSRRSFINYFLGGGALTFFAAVGYPVLKYFTPPPVSESNTGSVSAGKVEEYGENEAKVVKFGNKPALVIRRSGQEFKAFIAVCTHLSCTVQYLSDDHVIWCACHNGKYDLNGINVSGPPPRPLTPLKVNISNDEIFLTKEA